MPGMCGTCRHWGDEHDQTGWRKLISLKPKENETERQRAKREHKVEEQYHTCQKVVHPQEWNAPWEKAPEAVVAYVTDASNYYAGLVTQAVFGCTLWEGLDG